MTFKYGFDIKKFINEDFTENEFINMEQEFSSASTANGNATYNHGQGRVPVLFKRINFPKGSFVLDYGCGKSSTVNQIKNYLAEQDVEYSGYDKFNQTPEEQKQALISVKNHGGADIVTCANVLNVIKERNVRVNQVIKNIYNMLKPNGIAYFDVYSDNKQVGPRATGKDKWQEFRGIETYADEVGEIFGNDNVKVTKSYIMARK